MKKTANEILITLEEGAKMPTRANKGDAGWDLYCREDTEIPAGGSAVFDTGVHVALPEGTFGKLESKSGLNVKYDVVSLGGVIDSGYRGSIQVKLYNLGKEPYRFLKGEKIVQMVVLPYVTAGLKLTDRLDDTERGDNGFGSSGR